MTAIYAAVDIAAVQQASWRRLDMLATARRSPLDPTPGMALLDDLFFSLLLLTGRDPERTLARLDADRLEARLRGEQLQAWVEGAGYDSGLPAKGVASVHEARTVGADERELLTLAAETIDRARTATGEVER